MDQIVSLLPTKLLNKLALAALFGAFGTYSWAQPNVNTVSVCLGQANNLMGSYAPSDTLVSQWRWDLDNDGLFDNGTGQVMGYVFPMADTNWIGLEVSLTAGGNDTVLFPVVVYPVPDVNFHVDNACEFQTAMYNDQSTITSGSVVQYQWDFDDNGTVDNNSGPVVPFTVGPATTYVSRLTCVSDMGCTAFATKTTQIFHQPAASFNASDVCLGDSMVFNNTSSLSTDSIAYYLWDFGNGDVDVTPGNTTYTYNASGGYSATLIAASVYNCFDTAFQTVTVNAPPAVSLTYTPDSVLIDGSTVTIGVSGTASAYNWSTSETSSSITISSPGTYSVVVADGLGCSTTLTTDIVLGADIITVNDIMTPNSDGINDFFEILNVAAIGPCDVRIYNRWNDMVYSSNDYNNDWDGTRGGRNLDAGTYFFTITCGTETKMGSLNILR